MGVSLGGMDNCHVGGAPESACVPHFLPAPWSLEKFLVVFQFKDTHGSCRSEADTPPWLSYLIRQSLCSSSCEELTPQGGWLLGRLSTVKNLSKVESKQ